MEVLAASSPAAHRPLADVSPLIDAVENRMRALLGQAASPGSDVKPVAQQAATGHLMSGGQRIRAQLAIQAGLALDLCVGDVVSIAAAAELVHNASLVHDDLQDRDATRHGVPTVWAAFGDGVAICTGDLLLSAAYCALAGISQSHLLPALIAMVHSHLADAAAGQCADLTNEASPAPSMAQYEQLAALKSGALIALPIGLALVAAGQQQALGVACRAARAFAIGYQMFDDMHDVDRDLSRPSAQPAINVIAVITADQPLTARDDAFAAARSLALAHLTEATASSLLLPRGCGKRLHELAAGLHARISAAAA